MDLQGILKGKIEIVLYIGIAMISLIVSAGLYATWNGDRSTMVPPVAETLPLDGVPLSNKLAVVDGRGRLWLVDPESGDRRPLTPEGRHCRGPAWSPDGAYIAYIQGSRDERRGIRAVSSNDGTTFALSRSRSARPLALNWSPDGRYLSYSDFSSSGMLSSVMGVVPGTKSFLLGQNTPSSAQWSDDGRALLWIKDNKIRVTEVGDRLATTVTAPNVDYTDAPTWGPGGRDFIGTPREGSRLILTDGGDSESSSLVSFEFSDPLSIAASPDRSRLAVLVRSKHTRPVYSGPVTVLSLDSEAEPKTFPLISEALIWSPDNRHVAIFSRERFRNTPEQNRFQLPSVNTIQPNATWWIFDSADGTYFPLTSIAPPQAFSRALRALTRCPGIYQFWDPTGTRFAVSTKSGGREPSELWVLDVFGEEPPLSLGEGSFATWTRH